MRKWSYCYKFECLMIRKILLSVTNGPYLVTVKLHLKICSIEFRNRFNQNLFLLFFLILTVKTFSGQKLYFFLQMPSLWSKPKFCGIGPKFNFRFWKWASEHILTSVNIKLNVQVNSRIVARKSSFTFENHFFCLVPINI